MLQIESQNQYSPLDSSIDKSPYINFTEDGLVTAVMTDGSEPEDVTDERDVQRHIAPGAQSEAIVTTENEEQNARTNTLLDTPLISVPSGQKEEDEDENAITFKDASAAIVKRCLKQLSKQSRKSMWLLVYVAIVSTWPLVGSALLFVFRKKLKGAFPASLRRR